MASQEAVFLDTCAQIRFQSGESQLRPRPQEKGGMPALQSVSHSDWVRQAYPDLHHRKENITCQQKRIRRSFYN